MSAQWKPGDVAMIEVGCHANVHRGMFIGGGWRYGDDKWVADDPAIVTVRPLLVIDPEDREQVERLVEVYADACRAIGFIPQNMNRDALAAALRCLAQPEDPEPTGLGAVVRDGEGRHWVKYETSSPTFHWRRGGKLACEWNDIPRPLTVLSAGWTEDER